MPTKMTIFFQKNTGNIKCIADWETTINDYFVEEGDKLDYALIWDTLIIDYNETVFNNYAIFRVDSQNNTLVLKNEIKF